MRDSCEGSPPPLPCSRRHQYPNLLPNQGPPKYPPSPSLAVRHHTTLLPTHEFLFPLDESSVASSNNHQQASFLLTLFSALFLLVLLEIIITISIILTRQWLQKQTLSYASLALTRQWLQKQTSSYSSLAQASNAFTTNFANSSRTGPMGNLTKEERT